MRPRRGPLVHGHIHHSQRALVELGLRGPKPMATVPPLQQQQSLLVMKYSVTSESESELAGDLEGGVTAKERDVVRG